MSLNSKEFKNKYNRSKVQVDLKKEEKFERESEAWDDYFEFLHGQENYGIFPTMDQLRQGNVFTILSKLGLRTAKAILFDWF